MNIDWKRKLSSRKFWVALVGFITPLLFAFGVAEVDVEKVASIIMAGSTLITYILVEGNIDAKKAQSHKVQENYNISETLD